MKRDAIAEWRNAQRKRQIGRTAIISLGEPRGQDARGIADVALGDGGTVRINQDLNATRRICVSSVQSQEFAATIRLLQRHNKLMQSRFGAAWSDAALMLLGEAHRRGADVATLTRRYIAKMRRDAMGGTRATER